MDRFNRGGHRGGHRNGGGNRDGFRRGFGGPREMHKAICSECGKECEVPFKPKEDRPVYCKECYMKKQGFTPREERPSKEESEESEEASEESEEESEESEEEPEESEEESEEK